VFEAQDEKTRRITTLMLPPHIHTDCG